jgi:hypothetical protein
MKRRSRKVQQLRQVVSTHFAFLFDEFGAKFVNKGQEYFPESDTAIVTLEIGSLLLKAVSFRDGFYMDVAPVYAPTCWVELGNVLEAIGLEHPVESLADVPKLPTYLPPDELAKLLKQRWPEVQRGLSKDNFDTTERTANKIKELRRCEYMDTMNRNVEFYREHPEANPWKRKTHIQTLLGSGSVDSKK